MGIVTLDLVSFGRACVTLRGNFSGSLLPGFPFSKVAVDFPMFIPFHKTEVFEALCVDFLGRIFSTAACNLQSFVFLGCVGFHVDSNHTSACLLHGRQPCTLLLAAAVAHQRIRYDIPANFNLSSVGVKVVEWDDDGFVGGKLNLPSRGFWKVRALTPTQVFLVTQVGKVLTRFLQIDDLAITRVVWWPRSSNVVGRTQIPAPLLLSTSTISAVGSTGVAGG
ncbi:MAG: hypothetical protein GY696_34880, partial [Gammaproteobacteria bacterium]|nr:hypothetical protein [Gammaproteobacteria bacterium]